MELHKGASYDDKLPVYFTKDFPLEDKKKAIAMAKSLKRRKLLEHNLGKPLGYAAWIITFHPKIEDWGRRMVATNPFARSIYAKVRKKNKVELMIQAQAA